MYSLADFQKDLASGKFHSMSERWDAQRRIGSVDIVIDAETFRSRSRGGEFALRDPHYNAILVRHGSPAGIRSLRGQRGRVWFDPSVTVLRGTITAQPNGELIPSSDLELLVRGVPLRFVERCGFKIYDPPSGENK